DTILVERLADAAPAPGAGRGCRFDRNSLLEIADAKRRVDGWRGANLQHDSSLDVGATTLQRDLEPVRTRRKVRHHIVTAGVGDDSARERRVGLGRRDCYAWKHGAALVGHTAVEFRGRLCPGSRAG